MSEQNRPVVRYWFSLLGSVRAWRDDVELVLGSPQQQAILALLVLHRGTALSVHGLVDGLWPTDPPRTAVKVVRTYVHRLRRVLACDGASLIHTLGDRYLMRIEEDQCDLGVFLAEVTAADVARRGGDEVRADRHVRTALELWRDQPLAGLPDMVAEPFRVGLMATRRAALDAQFSYELRHGDVGRAAVELAAILADSPLDERFREQLMVALYRSGRQAEALAVYRAGQRLLADEVGVDPGPALRTAHERILAADPALLTDTSTPSDTHGVSDAPVGYSVPRQLPADLSAFAGRSDDLRTLDHLFGVAGEQVAVTGPVIVSGTAGVGKTSLVIRWAHLRLDLFPDGQIHLDLRGFGPASGQAGVVGPGEALLAALTALGVPAQSFSAEPESMAAAYRNTLAGRRVLVVADNVANEEQVRLLVAGSPGSALLITSRAPLLGLVAAANARTLELDVVADRDAHQILAARLGVMVEAERAAVSAIVTRCAGLPLALAVVSARAANRPTTSLADLVAELDEQPRRLDGFGFGDRRTDVREVFSWSYRALSDETARAFRLLALNPAPETAGDTAAALLDRPGPVTRRCLDELRRAHLVGEPVAGRYTCHDLLREYALELCAAADTDADRYSAVDRLHNHVLDVACAAAFALVPYEIPAEFRSRQASSQPRFDLDSATAWFERERAGLVALVHEAARRRDPRAWRLAWAAGGYLDRGGHWYEQLRVHEASLLSAQASVDLLGQAYAHRGLARVHANFADLATARHHSDRATALFDRFGQPEALADNYRQSSWIAEQADDLTTALTHARRALAIQDTTANRLGQASALNAVGWCHALRGEFAEALAHCGAALTLFSDLGHQYGQADTLDSIGYANHRLGHHDQAVRDYTRALRLYQRLGVVFTEADTTDRLGDALLATGDRSGAHRAWERSATLFGELRHVNATTVRAKIDTGRVAVHPA